MRSQLSRLLRHTVQPRRANISSIADATRLRTCSSSSLLSNPWQPPQPPQLRNFSTSSSRSSGSAASNPQMAFPCLDAVESRTQEIASRSMTNGPEPSYTTGAHREFTSKDPLLLDYGGRLKEFTIAYETWGEMNADKSNVILLHTGLSASSHAKSNANNPRFGWWEKFIGPGLALDTSRFHVICTNVLGGCYGSTGPACIDPADGKRYATRFPILTMNDMVRAQFRLLDALGVDKLMASVGASMGGMQSLAAGVLYPDRIGRIVSISGCARSHPYSIALRHAQRQVLMADSNWNRGFYYGGVPPHLGMKLARQIATVTYRSGPEWEQRFGRQRADPSRPPALCPDFLIETYLDHAGEKFCLEYDANSLLYVSKAMDLFDLGIANQEGIRRLREKNKHKLLEGSSSGGEHSSGGSQREACTLSLPRVPYTEQQVSNKNTVPSGGDAGNIVVSDDLVLGLSPMRNIPTLVLGVESDILFPAWQQREVADTLRKAGNTRVKHVELGQDASLFGHDSFLLDVKNIGGSVKSFLEEFV